MCDWGSLRKQRGWGWDWKGRLIRWPPMVGAWMFPAAGGGGVADSRAGQFPTSLEWLLSPCSSDVKVSGARMTAAPVMYACAHMNRNTPATRGWSVFQSPLWGCRQGSWSRLQPRQNEGTSWAAWLLAKGFSLPDWVAVLLYGNLWCGCKDAEDAQMGRKGSKRLLVYRERRKTPSWNCFQACPRKAAVRCFEVASAFCPLFADSRWLDPYLFQLLAWYFISSILPILVCWMSRYVAERKQGEVWWMLQMKWNLVFGCAVMPPTRAQWDESGGPLG